MDDWFKDPFFNTSNDPEKEIKKQIAEVEHHMTNMMNSMNNIFRNFGAKNAFGLEYDEFKKDSTGKKSVSPYHPTFSEDSSKITSQTRKSTSKPKIEYPDDSGRIISEKRSNDQSTKPYVYASTMSSLIGPDGFQQSKRKTYDSASGKTELAEMKALGDQAIAVKREIDRDGKITDSIDRKNVDEKDVNDFRRRWDTRANQMSLQFRNTTSTIPRNALK